LAPGVTSLSGKKSNSGSPIKNKAGYANVEKKNYKADERIMKQKKQFENLVKEYKFEQKMNE